MSWKSLNLRKLTEQVDKVFQSFHIPRLTVNGRVFTESFTLFPQAKRADGEKMGVKDNTTDYTIQAKIKQFKSHFSVYKSLCVHICTFILHTLFLNDVRALKSSLLPSYLYSKGLVTNAQCQIHVSPEQS